MTDAALIDYFLDDHRVVAAVHGAAFGLVAGVPHFSYATSGGSALTEACTPYPGSLRGAALT